MRDVNRIDPFLQKIGEIWKTECPDWRFGQLIFNLLIEYGVPFYWEEEDFLENLEDYFKHDNKGE